jgi:hypothetical protein
VSRGKTLVVDFDTFLAWPVVCLYSPGNRPRDRWSAYIVRETDLVKHNHE